MSEPDPWWRWPAKVEPDDEHLGWLAYGGLAFAVLAFFVVLIGAGTWVGTVGIVLAVAASLPGAAGGRSSPSASSVVSSRGGRAPAALPVRRPTGTAERSASGRSSGQAEVMPAEALYLLATLPLLRVVWSDLLRAPL